MIDYQEWLADRLVNPVEAYGYYLVSTNIYVKDKDVDFYLTILDDIITAQEKCTEPVDLKVALNRLLVSARFKTKLDNHRLDDIQADFEAVKKAHPEIYFEKLPKKITQKFQPYNDLEVQLQA